MNTHFKLSRTMMVAAVAGLMIGTSTIASAATFTIGTDEGLVSPGRDNQGWWNDTFGNSNSNNDNYIVGMSSGGSEYRNYFTFDLSGLVGQVITSIELQVRRYGQTSAGNYTLWDVDTSAADLAQRNTLDTSIFNDLGSGDSYGSTFVATGGSTNDVISFTLSGDAIADANAAIGGYFSVGGTFDGSGLLFTGSSSEPGNFGSGFTQQLVIETTPVPLPAGGLLLLTGLGGVAALKHRKKRAA
ncbi:MAG: VPLPA-CTERM sorting domain-containing protein [Pseudomonadota bacterium]